MQRIFWRISKWAFIALVVLAIMGVGAATFVPSFSSAREGCYWTDAMVGYIDCPNVPAGSIIAYALNLPFLVFFYSGMFLIVLISTVKVKEVSGPALLEFLQLILPYLMYQTLLVLGGIYLIRWIYVKVRSRFSRIRRDK